MSGTGGSKTFVGQVAEFGSDDWTTVVTDSDPHYVAHSLRWEGYRLLRRRVRTLPDDASPRTGGA